jgi:hypothetical protein
MATERQNEANKRNALLSTGPNTPEGKARSRANALKHGLAADTLVIDALQADFAERKAEWQDAIQPMTPEGDFALDAVVACTFRIEECRRSLNARIDRDTTRACLVWDLDREADVALVASKLAKQPEFVSHQLQTSKHGVELILRTWDLLGESLDAKKGAWSDAELSTVFDLLGTPGHLRDGRAPFDPRVPGGDVHQSRRDFVFREYGRLETKLKDLVHVDRKDRLHAENGASVLGSKPAALIMRYERQAWQRYDAMLKVAKESGPQALAVPELVPEPEFESELDEEFEAEPELELQSYDQPNEPNSRPAEGRNLNRHQRRKQAAKARKV